MSTTSTSWRVVWTRPARRLTSRVSDMTIFRNLLLIAYIAEAVSFNVNLCARVNVTIPNFLGCAVTSTSAGITAVSTTQGQTSTGILPTFTVTPVIISSGASAVTYNGGSLLTGTCTSAQFASATLVGGAILQYPWEGCARSNPGCCPFNVAQPGPLNVCPSDYFTTSGACCPTYVPYASDPP